MAKITISLATVLAVGFTATIGPVEGAMAAPPSLDCENVQSSSGFQAAFWSPYDNLTAAQITTNLTTQKSVGINEVIVSWSAADTDRGSSTAYDADPNLGYNTFNELIPHLVEATRTTGTRLWMGLLVAPDVFTENASSQSYLDSYAQRTIDLAADLYAQFGDAIGGWYIPTEPNEKDIANPQQAEQYGQWLGLISDHLHKHLGDKPVMVSPTMPTAIRTGWTPTQFIDALTPLIQDGHVDVWNLQDGFAMTGWSVATEQAAFLQASQLIDAVDGEMWASVYTPLRDGNGSPVPVSLFAPYLRALAATGAKLSEWTFTDYMDPDGDRADGSMRVENYRAYEALCGT